MTRIQIRICLRKIVILKKENSILLSDGNEGNKNIVICQELD